MTTLKEVLKEEEEEFEKLFGKTLKKEYHTPYAFIQSYNAKIIKAVTEEMVGNLHFIKEGDNLHYYAGYNKRVQEELTKAQQLREEVEGE